MASASGRSRRIPLPFLGMPTRDFVSEDDDDDDELEDVPSNAENSAKHPNLPHPSSVFQVNVPRDSFEPASRTTPILLTARSTLHNVGTGAEKVKRSHGQRNSATDTNVSIENKENNFYVSHNSECDVKIANTDDEVGRAKVPGVYNARHPSVAPNQYQTRPIDHHLERLQVHPNHHKYSHLRAAASAQPLQRRQVLESRQPVHPQCKQQQECQHKAHQQQDPKLSDGGQLHEHQQDLRPSNQLQRQTSGSTHQEEQLRQPTQQQQYHHQQELRHPKQQQQQHDFGHTKQQQHDFGHTKQQQQLQQHDFGHTKQQQQSELKQPRQQQQQHELGQTNQQQSEPKQSSQQQQQQHDLGWTRQQQQQSESKQSRQQQHDLGQTRQQQQQHDLGQTRQQQQQSEPKQSRQQQQQQDPGHCRQQPQERPVRHQQDQLGQSSHHYNRGQQHHQQEHLKHQQDLNQPGQQPKMRQSQHQTTLHHTESAAIDHTGPYGGVQEQAVFSKLPPVIDASKWIVMQDKEKWFLKLSMLGRGGFSEVFKVLSMEDNEVYALKAVQYTREGEGLLRNEIKILQKLKGLPWIVELKDFFLDRASQVCYILLELGTVDLSQVIKTSLREENHLSHWINCRKLWLDMVMAVKTIHDNNIVHSDLKPANFLMVGPHLKLIDFGISTKLQDDSTSVLKDTRCGTFNYMAPEMLQTNSTNGEVYKVGRYSDVWSMGCILYLMLYGHTPFQHLSLPMQKFLAIINPDHQIEYPAHPDKQAVRVIQCCLQRNPKQRPTVQDLLQHPFISGDMH